MASALFKRGLAEVREAVRLDAAKDNPSALRHYSAAIELLEAGLKGK